MSGKSFDQIQGLLRKSVTASSVYFPISQVYKELFGAKVVKVPVSIAESCPNRMGLKGMKTCIFCDQWGSFAYPENRDSDLNEQIELHRANVRDRHNARKFLIYFQAYTTTFTGLDKLKRAFDLALTFDDVVGIVVGTRPDCLSPAVLRTWQEYSQKTFLSVEYGVQSFSDEYLMWMRRGHTAKVAIEAIRKTADAGIDTGVHLIFGWPGENQAMVGQAAEICNELPISNVKLHNLHVLANTPLAEMYAKGEFAPIEFEEYCQLVGAFLERLSPKIAIHRLAAVSNRWDELIAPEWTMHKMRVFQGMLDYFAEHRIVQGRKWHQGISTNEDLARFQPESSL